MTSKATLKIQESSRPKPNFIVHFTAGGFAGMAGAAVTCPLEVVKTRFQSSLYKTHHLNSVSHTRNPLLIIVDNIKIVTTTLNIIRKQEGIRAWWKGLGPNLVGVIPARAIYFAVYSQGKHFYTALNNNKETPIVHVASAASAGIATSSCTNPLWLVKTRMQLQSSSGKYKDSFDCVRTVIREEGIRGLYKGLSASYLGLMESTFQFVLYEALKKEILERRKREAHVYAKEPTLNPFDSFLAAGIAKLTAAVTTYPHEVLRTRLRQTPGPEGPKYTGLVQAVRLIAREEGFFAFYGGMTAHLMRTVPNAAIMFFSYELITSAISSWSKRERNIAGLKL